MADKPINPRGEQNSDQPWYREGLRFECTGCGACCSGAPGHVWVEEDEIEQMAAQLEMPVDQFERKFIRRVGTRYSLVEYPDGDCIFLDAESRKCTIYSARPVQCRTWPFWTSNVQTRRDWKQTCRECPGSGTGRLYTLEEIEDRRLQRHDL